MEQERDYEIFKARLQADAASQLETWKETAIRERRAWEHHLDWELTSSRAVIDFALISIRSLILINGGAVLAILAFLGSVWKASDGGRASEIANAISSHSASSSVGLSPAWQRPCCRT